MAILKSAKKAIRSSVQKRLFNLRRKAKIDDAKKKVIKSVKAGKTAEVEAFLKEFYKSLDKAAKSKYLKKNTASRLKSRMTKFVNKSAASKK